MTKTEKIEFLETILLVSFMALCVVPIKEINLFVNVLFPVFKWLGL